MWRASKSGDAWNQLQVFESWSCCVLWMIVSALYGRKRRLRQWASCFRVSHLNPKSLQICTKALEFWIKLLQICHPARRLRSQLEQRADEVLQVRFTFCHSMPFVLPLFWSMHFYLLHVSSVLASELTFFLQIIDYFVLAVLEASQCIAAELKAEAGWNNVKIALIGPQLELAWKSKDPTFVIHRRREEMSRMERFENCRCRWNWRRFEKICQNPRTFKSKRGVWYSGLMIMRLMRFILRLTIETYWN